MATLNAGQSTTVTLFAGYTLELVGDGSILNLSSLEKTPVPFSGEQTLGPLSYTCTVSISASEYVFYTLFRSVASVTGGEEKITDENSIHAFPFTSEAIQSAIDAVYASGQAGSVILAAATYEITSKIVPRSGVAVIGVEGAMTFSGDVPDSVFNHINGTIFNIAPGVTAFGANDTDQPTTPLNIGERSLSSITMKNIAFVGGYAGIKIGAKREMGCVNSEFRNLYFYNQTGFHFSFENFMHTTWGRIYGRTSIASGGGGMFFRASLNTARLIPGNSQIVDEIYCYTSNITARSIVFEVDNATEGAQMNEFQVLGRLQANRFGPTTPLTISGTTVNGSPDITVSAGDLANLPVGVPVGMTSAPSFLTKDTPYYVVANDGVSKIQISINPAATVGQSVSSTGAITLRSLGYPGIEINGLHGIFTYCNFGSFNDIECAGAIVPISIVGANVGCSIGISEIRPSKTIRSEINCYASGAIQIESSVEDVSICANGSSTPNFVNRRARPTTITGTTTLSPGHNQGIIYSTAAGAHNINVNRGTMPLNSRIKIVPTGAGQITFVPNATGTGVTINSANGLKTAAQYKPVYLDFVSEDRYNGTETWLLTGDTTV